MSMTFSAHYDGRVIVPDEPLSLPVGEKLELRVESAEPGGSKEPRSEFEVRDAGANDRRPAQSREAWLADFNAWIATQRSHNPNFDDSRESIYPDRS